MNLNEPTRGATQLAERTFDIFNSIMASRSKTYSEAHTEVIAELARSLAFMAYGLERGRVCWAIPTGGAKSTTALAAAVAMHQLDVPAGIVVCQNRIAALKELVRDLVATADPSAAIGLRDYQEHVIDVLEGLQPALGAADWVEVADALEADLAPSLDGYTSLDDRVRTALAAA